MEWRLVDEAEFRSRLIERLEEYREELVEVGSVTDPGRSGAIASVYASHLLGIPFIPYGQKAPDHLGRLLIIDTARSTGKTLRKAERKYVG